MKQITKPIILIVIIAAMVVTASAGSIGGSTAGSGASVSGNGGASSFAWNAEAGAGYTNFGFASGTGSSFSACTINDFTPEDSTGWGATVAVVPKEFKINGKVTSTEPGLGEGTAMAMASIQALVNRGGGMVDGVGIAEDGEFILETWIFAGTHTWAGSPGVTATASATASGTATASGATGLGSAMAESKGKATASSSATIPTGDYNGDSISLNGGSSSVSAAMIGAATLVSDVCGLAAGYPSYTMTPISEFHEFPIFDYIVYPYFYPGNGLATVNVLDGTGSAKSSASGSATASADAPFVLFASGSECEEDDEPVVQTSSSGTVAGAVAGTDAMAGAMSGINAWAFAPNPSVLGADVGVAQEGYLPTAVLDAGSTIFAEGGVIGESLGTGAVSSSSKKKPVTVDTATFSASGKSSGTITMEPDLPEPDFVGTEQVFLVSHLDATTSGSISGSATQDGLGASGSANAIAARALGYPVEEPLEGIEWGILLPSIDELNTITWSLGAGEGMLYSMLGSASGSIQEDGTGGTSATITGSAMASGDGMYPFALTPAFDGENGDEFMPGISGSTTAKGTIKSSTKAMPYGEAATTSQIMAKGGEGPLYGGIGLDYYDFEEGLWFSSEVGGMTYLTTMDYARDEGTYGSSTGGRSSRSPTTSATSSVSGQADFEGSSLMGSGQIENVGVEQASLEFEEHLASSSAKGTVTGTAAACNSGEADTGSLILSAAMAELSTDGLNGAAVDYSLILSDSSAVGGVGQTASAKGTADGSTTATSSLEYMNVEFGDPPYIWEQYVESTTTAKGKITTDVKAEYISVGFAVGTLKSYNEIQPASMDIAPVEPVIGPASINDDSVLATGARVVGEANPEDKSSATATLSGSTSSEGSLDFTVWEVLLPETVTGGDSVPPEEPEPEFIMVANEFLNGGTSVSNSDTAKASGTGSMGDYEGIAFNYACADQMTLLGDGKAALAQGIFGADAYTPTPSADVTAEATISNVKVNAYADPDGAMAEIGIKGGKASAKVMPTSPYAKAAFPSASSLTYEVAPYPGGGFAVLSGSRAVPGDAFSAAGVIADSRIPDPEIGEPPTIPEILCPVVFWS